MPFWNWLQQNSTAITALGNLLFVLIWTFYLQLFYRQYCRQQRAELVIHHAQGVTPSAGCLLVNMSQEAVHVQCVLAQVETNQAVRTFQVTDYRRLSVDDSHPEQLLRQGPLRSGDYLWLGRFEDIMRGNGSHQEQNREGEESLLPVNEIQAIELRTVVIHGPSQYSVGARRRFFVQQQDGQTRVRPEGLHTEQLSSRRHRRRVRKWLHDCFRPADLSHQHDSRTPA